MQKFDEIDSSSRNWKIAFLFIFLACTLLFCFLPKIIFHFTSKREDAPLDRQQARKLRRKKRLRKMALSILNCFASGVFLGVCYLDLMQDVDENFENFYKAFPNVPNSFPLPNFLVLLGFLILLTIEQMANLCRKESQHLGHGHHEGAASILSSTASTLPPSRADYEPIISHYHHQHHHDTLPQRPAGAGASVLSASVTINQSQEGAYESAPLLGDNNAREEEEEKEEMANIIEDLEEAEIERAEVPSDPAAHSQVRYVMLAIALSIHSIFEGLALGLVDKLTSAFQLFMAIGIHKCVVAFSFGLNIMQSELSKITQWVTLLVFSFASPVGTAVGIGIETVKFDEGTAGIVIGSLQSLACGSFLYIVFFELLPHEFFTHKKRPNPLLKVLALIVGIGLMSVVEMMSPV